MGRKVLLRSAEAVLVPLIPAVYRATRWLLHLILGRRFVLKVEGLEFLPAQGPMIICPKHQRWEDIPMVGIAVPRCLHYIAKVELFRRPLQREFLSALGGVPVDRDRPRATLSSFKRLLPLLRDQAAIVLFPEGTYIRDGVGAGKHRLIQMLLRFQGQRGVGLLSFGPVGLRYEKSADGYQVFLRLGPPLRAAQASQAKALTDTLMAEIARLSGEEGGE